MIARLTQAIGPAEAAPSVLPRFAAPSPTENRSQAQPDDRANKLAASRMPSSQSACSATPLREATRVSAPSVPPTTTVPATPTPREATRASTSSATPATKPPTTPSRPMVVRKRVTFASSVVSSVVEYVPEPVHSRKAVAASSPGAAPLPAAWQFHAEPSPVPLPTGPVRNVRSSSESPSRRPALSSTTQTHQLKPAPSPSQFKQPAAQQTATPPPRKTFSAAALTTAVQWPGDSPGSWIVGQSLTAPAMALIAAVVQRYGSGDSISIEHLNSLNRLLGARYGTRSCGRGSEWAERCLTHHACLVSQ